MHTYWWCMVCPEHGEYIHTAKGDMKGFGTALRHTDDTHHPTMTSIHPRPGSHGGNEVPSDQPA